MKKSVCLSLAALLLVLPLSALAKDAEKGKKEAKQDPAAAIAAKTIAKLEAADLNGEQKEKITALAGQFAAKMAEAKKKSSLQLTDEQKQAQKEAAKAAKEKGLSGAEAKAAVVKAVKITDEQQAAADAAKAQAKELAAGFHKSVLSVLTEEQLAKLHPKKEKKQEKPAKEKKPAEKKPEGEKKEKKPAEKKEEKKPAAEKQEKKPEGEKKEKAEVKAEQKAKQEKKECPNKKKAADKKEAEKKAA